MGELRLCLGCMSPLDVSMAEGPCPYCGYDTHTPFLPAYLAPGITLNNRYLVGRMLHYNGEGATYLAFDAVTGKRIFLKEYMPDTLCKRVRNSPTISVSQENLVQYKTFMSEFTELGKVMTKMRTFNHINPALDLFAENNTTYVTFPYVEGVTLRQYLHEKGGYMSWDEIKSLFPPIFTTLSLIHNAGMVHRGISPETILVTDKGELMLTGVCVMAARTAGTALAPEMFAGYAAPEQYAEGSWQGTWTDVYAISAVIYRALTGTAPLEAVTRVGRDSLAAPSQVDRKILPNISNVIMQGLSLSAESRLQTVTDLVTRLFKQPDYLEQSRTQTIAIPKQGGLHSSEEMPTPYSPRLSAPYNSDGSANLNVQQNASYPDEAPRNGNTALSKKTTTASRWRVPIIVFLIVIVVLGVAALVALSFINQDINNNNNNNNIASISTASLGSSSQFGTTSPSSGGSNAGTVSADASSSPTPETPTPTSDSTLPISTTLSPETVKSEKTFVVPDFVGKNFDSIKDSDYYKDVLVFQAEYQYNDEFPKGQIFNQDISPDKIVPAGQEVKLKVSMGSEFTVVPDYFGKEEKTYLAELTAAGIKYVTEKIEDPSVMGGMVAKTSIDPGQNINVAKGEVLRVYISTFYPVVSDVSLDEGLDINDNVGVLD